MPGGAIAVVSGQAGFDLKEILKRDPQQAGREALGRANSDVLVNETGIGIPIVANRNLKVRAAAFTDGRHPRRVAKLSKGLSNE
jgi:ribose 5-phosphate isomerase B